MDSGPGNDHITESDCIDGEEDLWGWVGDGMIDWIQEDMDSFVEEAAPNERKPEYIR